MNTQEIDINFKDFIRFVFSKKIIMIFSVLVFGGIFALFGYMNKNKNMDSYTNALEDYDEAVEKYEVQKSYLTDVCNLEQKLYDDAVRFRDDSYRMNMDPNNLVFSIMQFDVKKQDLKVDEDIVTDIEGQENAEDANESTEEIYVDKQGAFVLLASLKDAVIRYADWDFLEKKLNVEKNMILQNVELFVDNNEYKLSVLVKWSDKEGAEAITKEIASKYEENIDNINIVDGYKVELVGTSISVTVDPVLSEQINYMNNVINLYEETLEKDEETLELLLEPVPPKKEDFSGKVCIKSAIKFGLFGIIVGGIVAFIGLLEYFTRKGIVYSVEEYERISGHMLIADCTDNDILDVKDNVILKLSTKVDNDSRIMLLGSIDNNKMAEMQERLNDNSANMKFVCGVDENVDTIKELKNIDAVVAVYYLKKTLLPDIVKQDKLLNAMNKKIIGCIVI